MSERILVIDDEPLVLSSIERALLKVGYEVLATTEKDVFLNALLSNRYNLVIMDLHMKGVRPDELVEQANKLDPPVKLLTISGSIQPRDSKYFLQKPFKIDVLRKKVREILDEPS